MSNINFEQDKTDVLDKSENLKNFYLMRCKKWNL